jgi:type II secretory pathway pseudopilin PulG
MDALRSAARRDTGETLVELLVAVVVMGIAAAALVGGIATSITMSDIHHKQATAGTAVRDYAEALQNAIATNAKYTPCASASAYAASAIGYTAPAGYTAQVVAPNGVAYWEDATTSPTMSPGGFATTCPTKVNGVANNDSGLQKISLQVASNDARATETLTIIIRKPCRPGETACS